MADDKNDKETPATGETEAPPTGGTGGDKETP
jgi:hypothetical protein